MPLTDFTRIVRILPKPFRLIVQRIWAELNAQTDRYRAPRRVRTFDADALLRATEAASLDVLWSRLAERLHAVPIRSISEADYERLCPDDGQRIFRAAEEAIARRVDVLGTGPIELGSPINWHTDFKTGHVFPAAFMRDITYTNLGCPSDVKVPWEISRLQWLIPVGQAYLLTSDDRYADAAREVLDDWIAGNPYAHSVNWACTTEVAMRIFSWTWFFHVFCRSGAWADQGFRARFIRTLFLHGEFTERYIERSDVNGSPVTAAAAALVFAGLFFGRGQAPSRWAGEGWRMLCEELPRQVFPDGVNVEASIACHRLVLELFFLAARYREACGLSVPDDYRARVVAMARFSFAYTRLDGTTPLLGDADDGRTLPFGGQALTDHRYLAGLVGAHWHITDLLEGFAGRSEEIFWTLGSRAAALVASRRRAPARAISAAFPHGGCYVMRNGHDHVFIDCGPVGQAGRGGHGHNDCLSFEASIDGCHLVSDCGAYLYTASVEERNNFRSTAYHNTPLIDREEVNRFIRPDFLWTLRDDAAPLVKVWQPGSARDVFVGTHSGYDRLASAVGPVRTIELDHELHRLLVRDEIAGAGDHLVTVPLHLAPGVEAGCDGVETVILRHGDRTFLLNWSSAEDWTLEVGTGRISPSYGLVQTTVRLLWRRSGPLPVTLSVSIAPASVDQRRPAGDLSLAARSGST